MNLSVFRTYPDSGSNGRCISDEPSIRIVICRSRLSCDFAFQLIYRPQTCTRTIVDHALHQVLHEISGLFADRLTLAVSELAQHIALIVLYPGNELRRDVDSARREGIVSSNHLIQRQIRRSDAE